MAALSFFGNAKTCLLVIKKAEAQQNVMALD